MTAEYLESPCKKKKNHPMFQCFINSEVGAYALVSLYPQNLTPSCVLQSMGPRRVGHD